MMQANLDVAQDYVRCKAERGEVHFPSSATPVVINFVLTYQGLLNCDKLNQSPELSTFKN